jgi:hypothetical protein
MSVFRKFHQFLLPLTTYLWKMYGIKATDLNQMYILCHAPTFCTVMLFWEMIQNSNLFSRKIEAKMDWYVQKLNWLHNFQTFHTKFNRNR